VLILRQAGLALVQQKVQPLAHPLVALLVAGLQQLNHRPPLDWVPLAPRLMAGLVVIHLMRLAPWVVFDHPAMVVKLNLALEYPFFLLINYFSYNPIVRK